MSKRETREKYKFAKKTFGKQRNIILFIFKFRMQRFFSNNQDYETFTLHKSIDSLQLFISKGITNMQMQVLIYKMLFAFVKTKCSLMKQILRLSN
jgi:hypothetical protein